MKLNTNTGDEVMRDGYLHACVATSTLLSPRRSCADEDSMHFEGRSSDSGSQNKTSSILRTKPDYTIAATVTQYLLGKANLIKSSNFLEFSRIGVEGVPPSPPGLSQCQRHLSILEPQPTRTAARCAWSRTPAPKPPTPAHLFLIGEEVARNR